MRLQSVNIHAFIFNWKNHFDRACKLHAQVSEFVRTSVINSEDSPGALQKDWHQLGESAYFSAQWNKALDLFEGDVLFHIQADANIENAELLIEKAVDSMIKHNLGVYEPNVNHTDVNYQRDQLSEIAPDLVLVPRTDCTCWFIHKEIVKRFAPVNLAVNKYGWGIDAVAAAHSFLTGRRVARDYSIMVQHPRSRGYSSNEALQQMQGYLQTLPPGVERVARQIWQQSLKLGMVKRY